MTCFVLFLEIGPFSTLIPHFLTLEIKISNYQKAHWAVKKAERTIQFPTGSSTKRSPLLNTDIANWTTVSDLQGENKEMSERCKDKWDGIDRRAVVIRLSCRGKWCGS